MDKILVIKLGGSIISKSDDLLFDFDYLKKFYNSLNKLIKQDYKFFVVVGGGFVMRKYRDLVKQGGITEDSQIHWIGTAINNLNAEIVRAAMSDICGDRIFAYEDYYKEEKILFSKPVIIGGAGRAGHSGDVDAVLIAKRLGVQTIISLKNIDAVYSSDPRIEPEAQKLKDVTWEKYLDVIGTNEHLPGANFPIDPIASADAQKSNKKFIIISGYDLLNFENVVLGLDFKGSTVY